MKQFTVRYTTKSQYGLTGETHTSYADAVEECRVRYSEQTLFTCAPENWVIATWIDTTIEGILVAGYVPTIGEVCRHAITA